MATEANWRTTDYGNYVEVVPIGDSKPHVMGDECWCSPRTDPPTPDSKVVFVHNSHDRREDDEGTTPAPKRTT